MRCGHASGHTTIPTGLPGPRPRLHEVIEQQRDDVIGGNELSALIQNPKTVGIAISGKPQRRLVLSQRLFQRLQVFLGRLRWVASEQNTPPAVDGSQRDARLREQMIEVSLPGSVERVVDQPQAGST